MATLELIDSCDRPGRYFDEYTPETQPTADARNWKKGERYAGRWRGVRSVRTMLPWLRDHSEFTLDDLRRALRVDPNDRQVIHNKVLRSAAEYVKRR